MRYYEEPQYIAPLNIGDPVYFPFDEAATKGPAAHLRTGPLTALPLGECGELLDFENGQPIIRPSAADGRTLWKHHDRLPWLAAMNDYSTASTAPTSLFGACVTCAQYNLTPGYNMPFDPNQIDFAHKGTLGWVGRAGSDLDGHESNAAEDAMILGHNYNRAGHVAWGWCQAVRTNLSANPNWITSRPLGREVHSHLVRAWVLWEKTGDRFWFEDAQKTAGYLMSKPLSQHNDTGLNDPLWPYTLVLAMTPATWRKTVDWLVQAAQWYRMNSWEQDLSYGLTLFAMASLFASGPSLWVQDTISTMLNWAGGFYRSPGEWDDWIGCCPGRTGDIISAQWPILKAAYIRQGIRSFAVKPEQRINTYPMRDGRFVDVQGTDLRKGAVSFISTGGDTMGGRIRNMVNGTSVGEINLEGPYGTNHGTKGYMFPAACTNAQVACFRNDTVAEQVLGPITSDYNEKVVIQPNVEYHLGNCKGVLSASGNVTIKPFKKWSTFYNSAGKPDIGLWAGKDLTPLQITIPSGTSLKFDVRGQMYSRWILTSESGGTWQAT